jgi:hypothetical protein
MTGGNVVTVPVIFALNCDETEEMSFAPSKQACALIKALTLFCLAESTAQAFNWVHCLERTSSEIRRRITGQVTKLTVEHLPNGNVRKILPHSRPTRQVMGNCSAQAICEVVRTPFTGHISEDYLTLAWLERGVVNARSVSDLMNGNHLAEGRSIGNTDLQWVINSGALVPKAVWSLKVPLKTVVQRLERRIKDYQDRGESDPIQLKEDLSKIIQEARGPRVGPFTFKGKNYNTPQEFLKDALGGLLVETIYRPTTIHGAKPEYTLSESRLNGDVLEIVQRTDSLQISSFRDIELEMQAALDANERMVLSVRWGQLSGNRLELPNAGRGTYHAMALVGYETDPAGKIVAWYARDSHGWLPGQSPEIRISADYMKAHFSASTRLVSGQSPPD